MLALFLFWWISFVQGQNKVPLGLYFESCCPYSQEYIVNSLAPAWKTNGFQDIVDIILSPWGHETFNKSASTGMYSYQCQHGPNECIGQRIESCAAMIIKPMQFVDFVIDLETQMYRAKCQNSTACCDPTKMAQNVAEKLDLPWSEIEHCVHTPQIADQAEMMQYGNTLALNPMLTGVPWITLNGNHTDSIQDNCEASTLECVCAAYNGKSDACKDIIL